MNLEEIKTPALLLDLDRLEHNLGRMAARADRLGVRLRPHIKTHKCVEVARRQQGSGARGITVSTLYEARAFAQRGFDDITWAFPVILNRLDEVIQLSRQVHLNVLADSRAAVAALEASAAELSVFLKIDCGYHRAGMAPDSPRILELARRIVDSRTLSFAGVLTHAGHSYHGPDREGILAVARQERDVMVEVGADLERAGVPARVISIGSTPTLSVIDDLSGIDEIRPGNYAFYDLTQVTLGACEAVDCALSVLSSVVSSPPGREHSVIDAGALAMSKDPGPTELGHTGFGGIYQDYPSGRLSDRLALTDLSQEHGIVAGRLEVGSRLRVVPNHSCLTAAQFDHYLVMRGDEVVDRWPILRGR